MKKIYWSKILITLLIGLPLLYTLLGFLVAPALLRGILEGRVAAAIGHDIAVSKIRVNPLEFTVEAENVAINDPDRGPVLSLRRFFMDVEVSSLFLDTNVVAQVILEQPWINIVLAEDGQLNLTRLVPPASSAPEPQKNNPPKPVLIESIAIHEASILFEDLNSEHPVRHIFEPINIELEQVSTRINALGLSEISILTEDGERALINSQFSLEPLRLRSTIDIADLNLKRLNPHLATPELPRVEHGRLNVSGRLIMDHGKDAPGLLYFQGNIQMADVGLSDGHKNPLIGFTGLEIPAIDLSLTDSVVAVERIALTGLWIETGLDDQGDLPPVLMAGRNPRQSDQDNAQSVASLKFHLGEFILKDGYIKFDDRSIQPPVHLELSELQARVGNVTNLADAVTDLTLDTVVNSTAKASAEGRIKPFAEQPDLELKFQLDDFDLIKMSAYAGKFIGYEIDRGQMGLLADYTVKEGSLTAEHDLLLSHFTLGAAVESPTAVKAPIKLGLSLLEDSQNRIKLKLPVEGDLNNPEFNLGSVIRKSFSNVITKLVSSPFSILGSIAGVKGDNLDYVGFYPGAAQLTEQEQKKLINISQALKDRPQLVLTLHPAIDKKADMLALKTFRFDQQIAQATKGRSHGHDPKILKRLYKKRFGSEEYSKKLESFRERKDEMENPEVQFIEALRQDLIAEEPVDENVLNKLAQERADNVQKFLTQQSDISAERLKIGKLKNAEASDLGLVQNKFSVSSK